jgi:DNA-binding FadR family transcriptional regulator
MREILEGSAARFAAEHATAPEIAVLWRLQKELCKPDHDATALVTLNRRLHQAIYEAAHNQYLIQTLSVLHDSLALLHSTTFRVPSRRLESDEEHRQIVAAIEEHNPDRAEETARQHIRQAQRTRFENAAVGM